MKAQQTDVIIMQIGKKGLTKEFYDQLSKNIHTRKTVKIRMLRNYVDANNKESAKQMIIEHLTGKIKIEIKSIGHIILVKKKSF